MKRNIIGICLIFMIIGVSAVIICSVMLVSSQNGIDVASKEYDVQSDDIEDETEAEDVSTDEIDLDAQYLKIIKEIEETQGVDTTNARKMYEAIFKNEYLTDEEKANLTGFIQYFVDNKYIDSNRVSEKFSGFVVTENDPSLLDDGIGASYNDDNSITFATDEDREYCLSHEILHAVQHEDMDYYEYGWFVEGVTCLANYEYFNIESDSMNSQAFFVRALCEMVDSDVIFRTDAQGDMDILISALEGAGLDRSEIENLFNLFYNIKESESYGSVSTADERIEVAEAVVEMYLKIYDCNEISESLFEDISAFVYGGDVVDNYYFNSTLKNVAVGQQDNCMTRDDLEAIFDEARLYG